jgi:type I restriction enzyme S subunit
MIDELKPYSQKSDRRGLAASHPYALGVPPRKRAFSEVDERSELGNEELLSVSHITGVTPRSQKNVT